MRDLSKNQRTQRTQRTEKLLELTIFEGACRENAQKAQKIQERLGGGRERGWLTASQGKFSVHVCGGNGVRGFEISQARN